MTPYMSNETYEALIMAGAERLGMSEEKARDFARERFPMEYETVLVECRARGLVLLEADLTRFLQDLHGTHFDDGEPITADSILWDAWHVERLLKWASTENIGRPIEPEDQSVVIRLADFLAGLRDRDVLTREAAGLVLTRLIERRVQGSKAAVVELVPHRGNRDS